MNYPKHIAKASFKRAVRFGCWEPSPHRLPRPLILRRVIRPLEPCHGHPVAFRVAKSSSERFFFLYLGLSQYESSIQNIM